MNSTKCVIVEITSGCGLTGELYKRIKLLVTEHNGLVQWIDPGPGEEKKVVVSGTIPEGFTTNLASMLMGTHVNMESR